MARVQVRQYPQEELTTKFTSADLRILGELSIALGTLHWQEDVGGYNNQLAVLLKQQEKFNRLVANIFMREI